LVAQFTNFFKTQEMWEFFILVATQFVINVQLKDQADMFCP
jgi:hypothetical protein